MSPGSIPAAPAGAKSDGPRRVPDAAFVAVRVSRPALVARLPQRKSRQHGLMLTLAAALMILGGLNAYTRPTHRAIVIPVPAVQGVVVT